MAPPSIVRAQLKHSNPEKSDPILIFIAWHGRDTRADLVVSFSSYTSVVLPGDMLYVY